MSEGVAQPSANDPRKFSCLIQLHVDLALSNTNNWRLFGIEAAHQLCRCGPWYHQLVHRVVSRLVKTSGLQKKRGCCTALNFEMIQHQEHQAEIPKGLNPDAQISVIFPSTSPSFRRLPTGSVRVKSLLWCPCLHCCHHFRQLTCAQETKQQMRQMQIQSYSGLKLIRN